MRKALIGYTGFVGSNLVRQESFDALYNSRNIDEIRGRGFDLLVCAGAPAEKWRANRHPEADRLGIERLVSALEEVETSYLVLISSVDVYPEPVDVDENTAIENSNLEPYGRHRRALEKFVSQTFPRTLILRLPGLFGPGLKKNALYDLIHHNNVDSIHSGGIFQFYNLANLTDDIGRATSLGLNQLNIATEPIPIREIAETLFSRPLGEPPFGSTPPRYDFRSIHSSHWGRGDGYLYSRAEVMNDLRLFVHAELTG